MSKTCWIIAVLVMTLLSLARPVAAAFHNTVIDEVVASVGGDTDQQFVEVRQLGPSQTLVTNAVIGAFDANGNYVNDVLVANHNVTNSSNGGRWIAATQKFQMTQGFTADFDISSGIIPVQSGMICYGSGTAMTTFFPVAPGSWDHTNAANYIDCVAYGAFTGSNSPSGLPIPDSPADHAIARTGTTFRSDADFACMQNITPKNNAGGTQTIIGTSCSNLPPPPPTTTTTSTTTTTLPPAPVGTALSGGPPLSTDCFGEWRVVGPSSSKSTVRCKHGDASCDKGTGADCQLRAEVCFGDADNSLYRGKCARRAVTRFALLGNVDATTASAVLDAVRALGGVRSGNAVAFTTPIATTRCTAPFTLSVPLKMRGGKARTGTRMLRSKTSAGKSDTDALKILCLP